MRKVAGNETKKATGEHKEIYERPAIIYEGMISTRAGSELPDAPNASGADAADIFGNG